jgi:hypothetical protein
VTTEIQSTEGVSEFVVLANQLSTSDSKRPLRVNEHNRDVYAQNTVDERNGVVSTIAEVCPIPATIAPH